MNQAIIFLCFLSNPDRLSNQLESRAVDMKQAHQGWIKMGGKKIAMPGGEGGTMTTAGGT